MELAVLASPSTMMEARLDSACDSNDARRMSAGKLTGRWLATPRRAGERLGQPLVQRARAVERCLGAAVPVKDAEEVQGVHLRAAGVLHQTVAATGGAEVRWQRGQPRPVVPSVLIWQDPRDTADMRVDAGRHNLLQLRLSRHFQQKRDRCVSVLHPGPGSTDCLRSVRRARLDAAVRSVMFARLMLVRRRRVSPAVERVGVTT